MRPLVPMLIVAAVAGCHRAPADDQRRGLDALDDQLTANVVDTAGPVGAVSLHDRIRVDPRVAQTQPAAAPGPTPTPTPRPIPAPTANPATIARAAGDATQTPLPSPSVGQCERSLVHGDSWSARLPAGLALYPGARIGEAAGSDAGGCALRVVSFTAAAPVAAVAGWYRAHAAGFRIEERAAAARRTVTGDAPSRAFILYLEPRRGGGTSADLIATGGR